MARTFLHYFEPPAASPIPGVTAELDISEIEDAGVREVLQTPGAIYGAWSILDTLLTPTGAGTPFIFREPLGQAREVKVALSGLFGRFVARAYLERYFNLSIFAHLGSRIIDLDRRRKIGVKRLSRGDLPDWIACASDLSSLTVAEAKGCHERNGPTKALNRAWAQAGRIDITVRGKKVTVKRIAIATRWGVASPIPTDAHLSVRDPVDEGEPLKAEEKDALLIGVLRLHIANLIRPLGHGELASSLCALTAQPSERRIQEELRRARTLLDSAPIREMNKGKSVTGLIGGIVTRAGPLADHRVTPSDQEALARINLRPVFVGVDRDVIRLAIDTDLQAVRTHLAQNASSDEIARHDRAGGWIIPLGEGRQITDGT